MFHPIDSFALEPFLNSDVCHGCGRCSSMPVLLVRREPAHIPGPNLLNCAALALGPAQASRDDQGLTEWMRVPGSSRPWLEGDARTHGTRRIGGLEERIDP